MKKNYYDLIGQDEFFTSEEAAFLEAIKNPKKRKEIIRLLEEAERKQGSLDRPLSHLR